MVLIYLFKVIPQIFYFALYLSRMYIFTKGYYTPNQNKEYIKHKHTYINFASYQHPNNSPK